MEYLIKTLQRLPANTRNILLTCIYGLAAGIWTSDVRRAHAVAHALSVGIVWINCWMVRDLRTPFGGMNASGLGREGGDEALRFFSEVQNVCIQL